MCVRDVEAFWFVRVFYVWMMYVLCYRVSEPARFGTVPAPATVTNIKRIRQAKACLLLKFKFFGPSLGYWGLLINKIRYLISFLAFSGSSCAVQFRLRLRPFANSVFGFDSKLPLILVPAATFRKFWLLLQLKRPGRLRNPVYTCMYNMCVRQACMYIVCVRVSDCTFVN